jgi:hypothetical protein
MVQEGLLQSPQHFKIPLLHRVLSQMNPFHSVHRVPHEAVAVSPGM